MLSSVVATAVGRLAFGSEAFLTLPAFHVQTALEYPLYGLLGLIAALVALAFLLALLAGKIVATSLTMAIGGSGGVFAPSLFMGAMLGSAFGLAVHGILPGATANPGAYGLVGMAAVFAAAGRAPITAVLIVFELTGDYSIILPLMLAVVIAVAISRALSRDSIYTLKLRRRGINIEAPAPGGALAGLSIADAMGPPPDPLRTSTPLSEALDVFLRDGRSALPVVDEQGSLVGVVTVRELERGASGEGPGSIDRLVREIPELHRDEPLEVAVEWLTGGDREALAIVAPGSGEIVGWLDHRSVLRAYASVPGVPPARSTAPAPSTPAPRPPIA